MGLALLLRLEVRMQIIGVLLTLFVVAFVVSLVISFLVNIVAGALSLLPAIFVIVAIWFFVRGGRIHIDFPGRNDRDRLR